MVPERKPDLHLEIGHVLFIDIVGYSKLLINQQSELLGELNEIVSGTDQFREAEAEDKLPPNRTRHRAAWRHNR
ncbi:MAG TPA: hypothetical protein VGQ82_09940 [Chthoniobacterales bacterium]|nr:hypothetical protein [Chthoniobacterales bacterium]